MNKLPPGPKGRRLYHTYRRLSGYREFLDQLNKEYGDIVYFQNLFQDCCVVFDPHLLHEMQTAQRTLDSASKNSDVGTGQCPAKHDPVFVKNHARIDFLPNLRLNTADGEPHRRMVKSVEPAFNEERLGVFRETIVEEILAAQARWRQGKVIRTKPELTRLSANIVFRLGAGSDLPCEPELVMGASFGLKFDVVLQSCRSLRF